MNPDQLHEDNRELLELLSSRHLAPFDLLYHHDVREKLVDLVLNESPRLPDYESSALFGELRQNLLDARVDQRKVVVFGGGTGLSNIIGGDSRQKGWARRPFEGLKQVFPQTKAVVCITDDGGSTGELLKDIPVPALGDIRHVMLSSIQFERLQAEYNLSAAKAVQVAEELFRLFNYRFNQPPVSAEQLISASGCSIKALPVQMAEYILSALAFCFSDRLCRKTLKRHHCLGNLIVLSAICRALPAGGLESNPLQCLKEHGEAVYDSLAQCGSILGAQPGAVLPSTITPAQLRFLYSDGVQVSGEDKSSGARRGFPVDQVIVDFCAEPYISPRIIDQIEEADILIMAPGSLYSSLIPVLQVPGIAEAVRSNKKAIKLLISNLWVQEGETDRSMSDPDRKFHVSDMIRAYERNLPGGTAGLFDQVLCLSLRDVPASVIQSYAVEGKVPIYLDRDALRAQGLMPIECGFFSRAAMHERNVIQHDPFVVAQTVKTLYAIDGLLEDTGSRKSRPSSRSSAPMSSRRACIPSEKYAAIRDRFNDIPVTLPEKTSGLTEPDEVRSLLTEIVWSHKDIPVNHLATIRGITCVDETDWRRDQRWDRVFSFYDPEDGCVKIRRDKFASPDELEVAFLVTVGQSLLGNYAAEKKIEQLNQQSICLGRVFHLHLRPAESRTCYLEDDEVRSFLALSRMVEQDPFHFTRVINGDEGFTPPGLLMGLMYAWYLDNRFASHIEYKMSITKIQQTDLIPEQVKMRSRREQLICFFRESVFGKARLIQQ